MAGGVEVAGVRRLGATVHGSRSQAHRKREKGKQGESTPRVFVARGVANAAVHVGAMAGAAGAHEEDSRDHVFAWEKAREGEGKEARSPRRKSKAETARFDG